MSHWKHNATRCAVIGCERTRVKGHSTCRDFAHYGLGKALAGAGRIEPIDPDQQPLHFEPDGSVRGKLSGCPYCHKPGEDAGLLCDDDHCREA